MILNRLAITLAEANAFVSRYHRHHPPVVGHKFSGGSSLRAAGWRVIGTTPSIAPGSGQKGPNRCLTC